MIYKKFLSRVALVLFVLVLIALVLNQLGVFKADIKSYPAQIKMLKNEYSMDAYLFRNEYILAADQGGDVTFLIEDGERVPKGTVVATVTPRATERTFTPFSLKPEWVIDIETIRSEYKKVQDQLSFFIKENKLSDAEETEKQLGYLAEVRNAFERFNGLAINEPVIHAVLDGSGKVQITAPHSGIVAYSSAYDDPLFHPNNIALLNYTNYTKTEQSQIMRTVLPEQPFIRIIDNRESYLVVFCDEKTMKQFSFGRRVDVFINGEEIRPYVSMIFKAGEQYGICLTVLEVFKNDYNDRTTTITVTPQKLEGLAIKTTSLIEQDKTLGVYVLKKGYRKEFMPVKVLGTFGEEAIIASDYFTTTDTNGLQTRIDTVDLYDEIVEDPQ